MTPPVDIANSKQLFLDHTLIDESSGVSLRMHQPRRESNPVVKLDQPYETALATASIASYSSVMFDQGSFRLWWYYNVGVGQDTSKRRVCYAESQDGVHFEKPRLGLFEMAGTRATNAVIADPVQGACVWIDPTAPPEQRYRSQAKWGSQADGQTVTWFFASPDGIHWEKTHEALLGSSDTQNVVLWEPGLERYVMYTRYRALPLTPDRSFRGVRRLESRDLVHWDNEAVIWQADAEELTMYRTSTGRPAVDYYGGCVWRYPESGNLRIFFPQAYWHWRDRPAAQVALARENRAVPLSPATIDVRLGFSRDGYEFLRAVDRGPFLPLGFDGGFDSRRVWLLPTPVIVGDEVWIYYTGTNLDHDFHLDPRATGLDSGIGRAILRLDGFVSVDSDYRGGWLMTQPFTFTGERLLLNLDTSAGGTVETEITDSGGQPIPGFSRGEAIASFGNSTSQQVRWRGAPSVAALAGTLVRLRIRLRESSLYAFQFK